jgi:hypothetical protein
MGRGARGLPDNISSFQMNFMQIIDRYFFGHREEKFLCQAQ